MKLQILVHQAEEGGYWAEVPSIPGAQRKVTVLRNCRKMSARLLRVAYRSMFKRFLYRKPIRFRSMFKTFPSRSRSDHRDNGLKAVSGKRLCKQDT